MRVPRPAAGMIPVKSDIQQILVNELNWGTLPADASGG